MKKTGGAGSSVTVLRLIVRDMGPLLALIATRVSSSLA